MKLLLGICAALLFACGGGAKKTPETPKPEPARACATMAAHVAAEFVRTGENDITEAQREPLTKMLTTRCETDAWSEGAIACLATATAEGIETCGKMLTEAQQQAIEDDFEKQFESDDRDMEAPTTGAPPPDSEGGSGGGRPKGKAPDDPCGGGA